MTDDDAPLRADQRGGAPHPCETAALFGQDAALSDFRTALAAGRLQGGWLIAGPDGVGKATLAYRLAGGILAGAADPTAPLPDDDPDLRRIRARAHPRLCVITRAVNSDTGRLRADITVDDARALGRFFGLSAADGGQRVVIIDVADDLNPAAANAILKSLEEPPPRTTLFLLSHQPARLLPTIRSRCRVLTLHPLQTDDLTAALTAIGITPDAPDALAALSGGSVGQAVRLLRQDGLAIYAGLTALLGGLPRLDRPALLKLVESAAARGAEDRFTLTTDLIDLLLSRAARAGLMGEPPVQGAPGEARLLTRLSPHDAAARVWADAAQTLAQKVRAGRAVNLDPAALLMDMFWSIEATAQSIATA